METCKKFDLNNAIHNWQTPLRSSGVFTRENLDELADHIKDAFENYPAEELSNKEKFNAVIEQMGDAETLIPGYAENNRPLIAREYILYFLMGAFGIISIHFLGKVFQDIFAFIAVQSGLTGKNLEFALYVSVFIILLSFIVLFISVFRSVYLNKKKTGKRFLALFQYPGLLIIGFIISVFAFHAPFIQETTFLMDNKIEILWEFTPYRNSISLLSLSLLIIWMMVLCVWSGWMVNKHRNQRKAILIKQNKYISFLTGGITLIVLFIFNNLAYSVFPILVLNLSLHIGIGNILLNILLAGVLMTPFLLYRYSHKFSGIILENWHFSTNTGLYKKLSGVSAVVLIVYLLSTTFRNWFFNQKELYEVTRAIDYSTSDFLQAVFTFGIILFSVLNYNRKRKKGKLIVFE